MHVDLNGSQKAKPLCSDYLSIVSELVDDGWIRDKDIGVKGGEATSSDIPELTAVSSGLDTGNDITPWALEGMEKLRVTTCGGFGSGEAALDTTDLFVAERAWLLDIKGPE